MLTFSAFSGINNVLPAHRLSLRDLVAATDVDIGLTGEVSRRAGWTEVSPVCHKNLHQSRGFMLATVGAALTAIWPDDSRHVVHPALGFSRVWYCNLPDGRTTFSNGLIHGVTDGVEGGDWSVPAPGLATAAGESAAPGSYRYHLTFVHAATGLEGPMSSSSPIGGAAGARLDDLPEREGYHVNVYLSGPDGEGAFLAGTATGSSYSFGSSEPPTVLPCRTEGAIATPVGSFATPWRGRVLVADGSTLWATMPGTIHLCQWRDFKQFDAAITLVLPVDDGIYVGTQNDLIFLAGTQFDALTYRPCQLGAVVPGSGVLAPGSSVKYGEGAGQGPAALCIAGGYVVAGFNGGAVTRLTDDRYRTDATEVAATWREINGVPQYIAVPQ